MKYYELDKEEKQILKDFESGKFMRVKNFEKVKKDLVAAAKSTLNKTKNINIRLTGRDLHKLKSKAIEEGIPYQTLVSSILHKYAAK